MPAARAFAAVWFLVVAAAAGSARAQDDVETARAAYARGAAAYDRGDYAAAAQEFALADRLAPNPVALEHALKSATAAGDAVLAFELLDRAKGRKTTSAFAKDSESARGRFAARVGKLAVRCPKSASCEAKLDGVTFGVESERWVTTGEHVVEISTNGRSSRHNVLIESGISREIVATDAAPPRDGAPERKAVARPRSDREPERVGMREPDSAGVSPVWFWVGAGVTLALGAVTTWSGLDTLQKHDEYRAHESDQTEDAGRSAQLRTNVLLGATAVAAAGTTALGLFVVDFGREGDPTRGAGAGLGVRGRF